MTPALPAQALSRRWHQEKYALPGELLCSDTQRRVAATLAQVESLRDRQRWAVRFEQAMRHGLLPGGRIMAGARGWGLDAVGPWVDSGGTDGRGLTRAAPTLMNCFVLPATPLQELPARLRGTLRAGGGVGMDFSVLPNGVIAAMDRCEAVARELEQGMRSGRRAAQMAVLRVDHPEIGAFIEAEPQAHPHMTRAVAMDDDFMRAVTAGAAGPQRSRLAALARAIWAAGEPGVLFTDRMRADDNLGDQETLSATNPCGEQPLPPFGACALASIDLTRVVQQPFAPNAHIAWGLLAALAHVGVRLLDNALDVTAWPLPQQARVMQRDRRIGLGITGLADALALLNLRYGSPAACRASAQLMRFIAHAAYRASVRLARERGAYPAFRAAAVLQPPRHASGLPADLRHDIRRHGLRHSHLLAIAPAASISVAFADVVSTGVEPMTAPQWLRHWQDPQGRPCSAWVQGHAYRLWRLLRGAGAEPPQGWVWLADVSPQAQLAMVAALAPQVDGAISKTLSVPEHWSPEDVEALIVGAWRHGLKGVSVFRRGSRSGVLQTGAPA